jgi:hypothetical protein
MIAAVAGLVLSGGAEEPGGELIVGPLSDIAEGSVSGEFVEDGGFWLVRSDSYDGLDSLFALRASTPVDGRETRWNDSSRSFECPGDGSRFSMAGLVLEGPTRRALERLRIALGDDGLLRVDPSRVFREEFGQWTDPESAVAP